VYSEEYGRTGFQGALQAYRVYSDPDLNAELRLFSGKTIDVPSLFIGGKSDWGTYSAPGAFDLNEDEGGDEDGWHRADRRRRSLGPTGAAGSAQHAHARLHQGGGWGGSHQRLGRGMPIVALENIARRGKLGFRCPRSRAAKPEANPGPGPQNPSASLKRDGPDGTVIWTA